MNKILYESRKEYFREYYKKNKEIIKERANERVKVMNPIQKAVMNQGRRKRRRISRGLE